MEPLSSKADTLSVTAQVHAHLQAEPGAFVLLDAARAPGVLAWLSAETLEYVSLYGGKSAEHLDHVAPYLAQLEARSVHTGRLLETSWGNAWGIYVFSDAALDELRRHFRRFLQVQMPDGRLAQFRFYDPRVLRDFLPAFSEEEKADFFGPVSSFLLEDADGGILRFTL